VEQNVIYQVRKQSSTPFKVRSDIPLPQRPALQVRTKPFGVGAEPCASALSSKHFGLSRAQLESRGTPDTVLSRNSESYITPKRRNIIATLGG